MQKLSMIMNYGCFNSCSYCIWKNHKQQNIMSKNSTFGFSYLNQILQNENIDSLVSLSGGGDPLNFLHQKNCDSEKLFQEIIKTLKAHNKIVSIHTRSRIFDDFTLQNVTQFVLSYDNINNLSFRQALTKLKQNEKKIRIAKVVDSSSYNFQYDINFAKKNNFEITFYPLNRTIKLPQEIQKAYEKLRVMNSANNKIYFMPDNKLYDDYGASVKLKNDLSD